MQARLDTLSLISDQDENVSYASNTLQASEEEMRRRIAAVDAAAKALESAQKVKWSQPVSLDRPSLFGSAHALPCAGFSCTCFFLTAERALVCLIM